MKNSGFNSLPVYKSSLVLRDVCNALAHYFSSDYTYPNRKRQGLRAVIAESLANDAALLPKTIAQVYETDSTKIRFKNALFINVITKNIISYCNGLEKDGVKELEYLQLLRIELNAFRVSFKQWRKSISHTDL